MKELVETTQQPDHLFTRSSVQNITSQPFRQMLRLMSRFVISVSGLVISPDSRRSTSPHDGPMVVRSMGSRYLGSFSSWNQANEVLGGRDRLFH